MTRRALVTGCAGFIGSHLCERLFADGWQVVGVDSLDDYYAPATKLANVQTLRASPGFRFEVVDLADAERTRRLAAGTDCDVVVHLAAVAGVRLSIVDPLRYVRSNVVATQSVIDAWCRESKRPLVFASSSSVYGNDSRAPFREDEPCIAPPSPYAATKRSGELLCGLASSLHGVPVTTLRFFSVYGPRQRPDLAIRKFATAMLREKEITVFGDGGMARDYTHVSDIVEGIVRAMQSVKGNRTYNLGNASPVTLTSLVGKLETALGVPGIVRNVPRPAGEMDVTCADVSRAVAELDWRPRVPFDDGLRDFADWLRAEERAGRNP